jgi:anti-sigma factor RsiW
MNCRRFQDELFEYLDGGLSRRAQAAARRHLEHCEACRQTVQAMQRTTKIMSTRFCDSTESLTLDPNLQTRILAAVEKKSTRPPAIPFVPSFWRSFAFLGAGFVLLLSLIVIARIRQNEASHSLGSDSGALISLQISYCDPTLTFRADGNYVIDSLTCQPQTVEESLQLFRSSTRPE